VYKRQEKVLGINSKGYFIHYYERLKHYSKIEERLAKLFLKKLCFSNKLTKEYLYNLFQKETKSNDVDTFNLLLSNLENDYYLEYIPESHSYYFASNILKDWWQRYYGL